MDGVSAWTVRLTATKDKKWRVSSTEKRQMKKILTVLGAGYVGGMTGLVFALKLPDYQIYVTDMNAELIGRWNTDDCTLPFSEPGLVELVMKCRNRNCFFTTAIDASIRGSDLIFLCINTPTKEYGQGQGQASNMYMSEYAVRNIASLENRSGPKIIVEKSTVPMGTADVIRRILRSADMHDSEVLSNPEFLAEGTALINLLQPDRVVIGSRSTPHGQAAANRLSRLYEHWVPVDRILHLNTWSAELSKVMANAMLAQRLSSVHTLTALCDRTGADVREVLRAVGMDSRLGGCYLQPSVGFGGSCLLKDCALMVYLCDYYNLPAAADYWRQVGVVNTWQINRFVGRMLDTMFSTLSGKKIAVFGFAFKKNTSDTRDSAAIHVVRQLLEERALVSVWDPIVDPKQILKELGGTVEGLKIETSPYACAMGVHAIVIMTDWDEFLTYRYDEIWTNCARPAFVFDGRNCLDHKLLRSYGFDVHGLGIH